MLTRSPAATATPASLAKLVGLAVPNGASVAAFPVAALAAFLTAFLAALLAARPAEAQERSNRGVISIREVVIVGRVQKPVASVDVNKIQPKLTLGELKQPFLDRIEEATSKDPF